MPKFGTLCTWCLESVQEKYKPGSHPWHTETLFRLLADIQASVIKSESDGVDFMPECQLIEESERKK